MCNKVLINKESDTNVRANSGLTADIKYQKKSGDQQNITKHLLIKQLKRHTS
jgi:hypothetical protein